MINLVECNKYADMVDDVGLMAKQLKTKYNDAAYYMSKNTSSDAESFSAKFVEEEQKIEYIMQDLATIASVIRNKSSEIYYQELEEKRRLEAEKAEAEANTMQ